MRRDRTAPRPRARTNCQEVDIPVGSVGNDVELGGERRPRDRGGRAFARPTETFIYNQCSSLARSVSLECPPLMIATYRVRVDWSAGDHPFSTVYSGQPVTFICPLI